MKKPIIGIIPLYDKEKDSYWMLPGYMKGIEEAGGIGVMLPLTSNKDNIVQIIENFDGFLLTGGQDISSELYNEKNCGMCGELCIARDEMEKTLLNEIIKIDKPVLGICRGIQIINAVLGGTLYQDLPSEYKSNTSHRMKAPYDRSEHLVILEKDGLLYNILNIEQIGVNSFHHQAIKQLAPALNVAATSEDGLIEAVYLPNKKFFLAVQWHPEFSYLKDFNSKKIFKAFIQSCFVSNDKSIE